MMTFLNKNLEMDLQNLISCIECHKEEGNTDIVIETLKTIVNICTEEEIGKDAFREVGGLDFLLQFIIDTDQVFILEFGLKVLAFVIDGNVHSQMHMTDDKVFRILQTIVKRKIYPLSLFKNAILLFSTLLFQNRSAQDIIQKNKSLLSLMDLYQCFAPCRVNHSDVIEKPEHLEVWLAVNSALCFAVNNPLHEKNQETCSSLFSLSLKIIEITLNPVIIEATSSFLSLSIANNEKNQDLFVELDGFQILKHSLIRNFEEIQSCIKECNSIIRKSTLQILSSLIAIVNAAVLDHENNASLVGKLGIIPLMTKLLSTALLDSSVTKKILLFLGHCMDVCNENRFIMLQVPKLEVLLKRNLQTDDPELYSAARYLLQVCLNETNKDNEMNQDCYSETNCSFLESCQHGCKVCVHRERGDFFEENISYQPSNSLNELLGRENYTVSEEFQNVNAKLHPLKHFKKYSQDSAFLDHYTYNQNKNYGNNSSESADDDNLQSAGYLYRMCHQINKQEAHGSHTEFIQENKLSNCNALNEIYKLNTNIEANHSDIRNITDCKTQKPKSCKCVLENSSLNGKELHYTEKMSSFKKKNKGSSHPKKSNTTAGCMEVIVLPGVACKEHKLVTQLELLKVCPLQAAT